ncbi:MAG TPA: hypothetical protein VI248_13945, partial [Kineosporiaceae bacterium]
DGRRDIISARDVGRAVAAAVLAAPEQVRERVFNVGTGHPTALRDLVHTVLRESGSSAALVEGTLPGSARSAAVLDAVPAVHRARATLGWVAHDDVATAVRDALAGSGLRRAS